MIDIDQLAGGWIAGVARSLLVTCALSLLLWAALRIPRARRLLTAPARHALWWLVCARFLLGLFPIPVVPVTVPKAAEGLSAPIVRSALAQPIRRYFAHSVHSASIAPPVTVVAMPNSGVSDDTDSSDAAMPKTVSKAASHHGINHLAVLAWLAMCAWLSGCLLVLAATLRGVVSVRQAVLASSTCSADEAVAVLLGEVCARMRCRAPRLSIHPGAEGPMAVGLVRPAIIMPQSCLDSLDEHRLRAVLAHEVAHIRRADLWLGFVPAICRIVLWFAPPVWLAARECLSSAEEACDIRARQVAEVSVAAYGETLIRLARATSQWAGAANLSPAYRSLLPRLFALKVDSDGTASKRQLAAGYAAVLGLALLLPAYQLCLRAHASLLTTVLVPSYALTDLGAAAPDASAASAINDPGVVAGYTASDRPIPLTQAVLWRSSAVSRIPTGTAYRCAEALAVNSRGDVALATYNYRGWQHAALASNGKTVQLGALPRFRYGVAAAVSDQRIVAGYVYRRKRGGQLQARPVLWTDAPEGLRPQEIGTLGGLYGEAYGVNSSATMVGKSDTPDSSTHAFAWRSGRITDLGTLDGAANSAAYAVNDSGVIVGYSRTASGPEHAVLWTSSSAAPMDLGSLFDGGISKARAINNRGDSVGVSTRAGGVDAHATLWLDGRAYDLNQLTHVPSGWTLRYAVAINNGGQIAGVGQVDGKAHAFLLTPAPRPQY